MQGHEITKVFVVQSLPSCRSSGIFPLFTLQTHILFTVARNGGPESGVTTVAELRTEPSRLVPACPP